MKTALIYFGIVALTIGVIHLNIKRKEVAKTSISNALRTGSFEDLEKIINSLPEGSTKNNLLVVLGAHYLDSGTGLEKILQQYAILEVERFHGTKTRH